MARRPRKTPKSTFDLCRISGRFHLLQLSDLSPLKLGIDALDPRLAPPFSKPVDSDDNRLAFVDRFLEPVGALLDLPMDKSGFYRFSSATKVLHFFQETCCLGFKVPCQIFQIVASAQRISCLCHS